MGLRNKLEKDGSVYAAEKNGKAIMPNPLGFDSKNGTYGQPHNSLHYNISTGTPGYSVDGINGIDGAKVSLDFQKYNDGELNKLPTPTALDLEDLYTADPTYKPKYRTSDGSYKGTYLKVKGDTASFPIKD
jgi:hypothetical protein